MVSRGSVETNWMQVVFELVAMFVPVVIISILMALFSETVTYIILLVIGLVFVVFHEYWLRHIYKRFMKRRYINMDSFRACR